VRQTPFLLTVFCIFTFAGTALASNSDSAPDSSYRGSIAFDLVLKHIVINVSVNNSRPLPFIFDTGDKFAIVDVDHAKWLGLKLQGDIQSGGAGAAVLHGSYVEGASFTIPGLTGFSQPVTLAFPLKSLEPPLGHEIDGIIGEDFINEFVVALDYQSRVLRLYDKTTFRYSGRGQSMPIELNAQGHPIIGAEITTEGGQSFKGKFVLDIGSSASLALYSPFVAEHHLLDPKLKTIRALGVAGAGGRMQAQLGRVAELKIGQFKLDRPITLFSQDKAGAFASSDIQGNLGEQILSRFTLFLDYSHRRVIFEPTKDIGQPFDPAFAGAVLEGIGADYETIRVSDILEDSPASESGLQTGDIITAVDGRPASALSVSEIADMFERSAAYGLDVQRGDTKLHIIVRPRKLI
jgi:hypothetical protein